MHPGEMLREEFLKPMPLTPYRVAKACGVPRTRIERLVREELGITADTALRLAKFFCTTVGFWMNLQARYDVRMAQRAIAADLEGIDAFKRTAACSAAVRLTAPSDTPAECADR
jgi:addiction module HigA family antidote